MSCVTITAMAVGCSGRRTGVMMGHSCLFLMLWINYFSVGGRVCCGDVGSAGVDTDRQGCLRLAHMISACPLNQALIVRSNAFETTPTKAVTHPISVVVSIRVTLSRLQNRLRRCAKTKVAYHNLALAICRRRCLMRYIRLEIPPTPLLAKHLGAAQPGG